MVQRLQEHTTLVEDLNSVPCTMSSGLQLFVTLTAKDMTSSVCLDVTKPAREGSG